MGIILEKIDKYRFRIPRQGKMRTDGIVYANERMIEAIKQDQSLTQVANVACLPGIVGPSMAMPDIHEGYGFPIGGVAAFDLKEGIISPGGVGFDINCGVRLLKSNLTKDEIEKDIKRLTDTIFVNVPSGVGSRRKDFRLNQVTLKHILNEGVKWALKNGFARNEDLAHIEEEGCLEGANPDFVSNKALERGKDQLGTLGSGNHFVEIGYVEKVYNEKMANALGLFKGEITILIHTGSRGLGHQVCDDYIKVLLKSSSRYGIELPDRQLCCAPISSEEGQQYLSAMACAANFAFTNRQLITHWVRETFAKFFKKSPENLGLFLIYDVCHNIAKIETHEYKGKKINVCVHRKGATRAFPSGHPDLPRDYKEIGQPVLIPGDMGRYSYVLVGTKGAMEETFGSTCFTGDTKILTDKGIFELKEVFDRFKNNEAFLVPSINVKTLEIEWKPVINAMKRKAKVIEVAISQTGRSKLSTLKTTPDHNFITIKNGKLTYKSVSNLIKNHNMVCLLDKLPTSLDVYYLTGSTLIQINTNPDLAYLIGALVSDRHIGYDGREGNVFKTDLGEYKIRVGGGYIRGKFMEGTATDYICCQKKPALELLTITKNLIPWVLSLDEESILNFIAGVIDGDGTWNPAWNVIDIFTADENVIKSLIFACLKVGILPYVSKQRGNYFIFQISEKRELIMKYTKRVKSHIHKYPSEKEKIYNIISSPMRMQRIKKVRDCGIKDVFNVTVEDNHNYIVLTDTFMPVLVKNCHGAGRVMSRSVAKKTAKGRDIEREMSKKGIYVRGAGRGTLVEEISEAYKDVADVIEAVDGAKISSKVVRLKPLGVVKG